MTASPDITETTLILPSDFRPITAAGLSLPERQALRVALETSLQEGSDPADVLEQARRQIALGHILLLDGDYLSATDAYEAGYGLRRRTLGKDAPETIDALLYLARCLFEREKFSQAEAMARHADAALPNNAFPSPFLKGRAEWLLGVIALVLARYPEAEEHLRRSRALFEEQFGSADSYTVGSDRALAHLYARTDRKEEAESLYRRSLSVYETTLGPDHLYTAFSCNDIAALMTEPQQAEDALALLERARRISVRVLGEDRTQYSSIGNNVACTILRQKRVAEAEELLRKCISSAVGLPDGPWIQEANYRNNLSDLLFGEEKLEEAWEQGKRALEIYESLLGAHHPQTARQLFRLAVIAAKRKDTAVEESYYRRAIDAYEASLGPYTPHLVIPLNNLAQTYTSLKRWDAADSLLRWALLITEREPNSRLFDSALIVLNMAAVKKERGDLAGAVQLAEQVAASQAQKALDKPTAVTLGMTLNSFAVAYASQGGHDRAESLYRKSLEILEAACGLEEKETGLVANNLGVLYLNRKQYSLALPYYDWALGVREIVHGPASPELVPLLHALAVIQENLINYAAAESYLRRLVAIVEVQEDVPPLEMAQRYRQLADVLDKQGKDAEAAKFRRLAYSIKEAVDLGRIVP